MLRQQQWLHLKRRDTVGNDRIRSNLIMLCEGLGNSSMQERRKAVDELW